VTATKGVALCPEFTQALTEMSIRDKKKALLGIRARQVLGPDNLTAICQTIAEKVHKPIGLYRLLRRWFYFILCSCPIENTHTGLQVLLQGWLYSLYVDNVRTSQETNVRASTAG
jgi:hypothetical protein